MKTSKFFKNFFSFSLFLIFILGFLVRMIGIFPGHPPNHPDEPITYLTAIQMVLNKEFDPFSFTSYKFQYPGLLIYLDAFFFAILFIPASLFLLLFKNPSFIIDNLSRFDEVILHVVGSGWVNAIFWGRFVVAFLGFLGVILSYSIGKKLFHPYVGLLAALFLAVNFRHNASSHLSLVDAPNATFALLALYLSLRLLESSSRKNYLLAGVGVGLSLAAKLYVFSVLPFLFVHLLLSLKSLEGNKIIQFFKKLLSINFFISIGIIIVTFVLLNPFLFLHLSTAYQTQSINNLRYAFGNNQLMLPPIWYLYEIGYGKLFSILFIVGILIVIFNKKYWIKGLLVSFFVFPSCYMLLYYTHGGGYVRNFTSVIPFAIILSALALFHIIRLLFKDNKIFLPVLVILGIIVSIPQFILSAKNSFYLSTRWNVDCVKEEMRKIAGNNLVAKTTSVPEIENKTIRYLVHNNFYANKTAYSLRELQEEHADYLVINYDIIQSTFINWTGEGTKHWGPPILQFENTFEGMAIKELSRYRVRDCRKPWPYMAENFSIMKIPRKKTYSNLISVYNDTSVHKVILKNSTISDKKILVLEFPVQPSKTYVIQAQVRPKKEIDIKVRDGFLRVDFYSSKPKKNEERGIIVALSSRFWGRPDWQKKEIIETASKTAKYMRISFQTEDFEKQFEVKYIEIFEVKDKNIDKKEDAPEIENSIIYPTAIL